MQDLYISGSTQSVWLNSVSSNDLNRQIHLCCFGLIRETTKLTFNSIRTNLRTDNLRVRWWYSMRLISSWASFNPITVYPLKLRELRRISHSVKTTLATWVATLTICLVQMQYRQLGQGITTLMTRKHRFSLNLVLLTSISNLTPRKVATAKNGLTKQHLSWTDSLFLMKNCWKCTNKDLRADQQMIMRSLLRLVLLKLFPKNIISWSRSWREWLIPKLVFLDFFLYYWIDSLFTKGIHKKRI